MNEEMENKAKVMADRLRGGIVALQMRIINLKAGLTALEGSCRDPLLALVDEYLDRTSDMAIDVGVIVEEAAKMIEDRCSSPVTTANKEKDYA